MELWEKLETNEDVGVDKCCNVLVEVVLAKPAQKGELLRKTSYFTVTIYQS